MFYESDGSALLEYSSDVWVLIYLRDAVFNRKLPGQPRAQPPAASGRGDSPGAAREPAAAHWTCLKTGRPPFEGVLGFGNG